jgi:eukaryotic translation initiation factor 2C
MSLGGGLVAVQGFYSSVRTAHKQLMVNVNGNNLSCLILAHHGTEYYSVACTTAFYKPGNLADALMEFMRLSFNARATGFVKGLRIQATHLGYRKTIKRATEHTASYRFDSGDFGEISVAEYFLKSKCPPSRTYIS